ncbi:MAG TPA: hypothetical protein VF477_12250 [Mycobacterium sp.]
MKTTFRPLALAGTLAYTFIPKLTGQLSYGGIFAKQTTERCHFLRLRLAYLL